MEIVNELRESFKKGITRDIKYRKKQLSALYKLVEDNEDTLCDAVKQDLNKSKLEAMMTEVHMMKMDISYTLYYLDQWLAPEKVSKTFLTMTDDTYIQRQPLGVVLVIGAWNYPILLALQPVIGALAAGNCVLLKPSEISSHVAKLLADLMPKYMDPGCCRVICGGAQETEALLKERFDCIFYTGSARVGRIVMEAAAKHLTPVILEMGGKCPAYIDESVDLHMAVKRLTWGKFCNAGQTCVAPDYVICHNSVLSDFIEEMKRVVRQFYGDDPKKSADFGRIINVRQFDRIRGLCDSTKGKVVIGGDFDAEQRYMGPTLITDVKEDDSTMSEEIFGPLLPVIAVSSTDEAVDLINRGEKPLAVYTFSSSKTVWKKFEEETTSGAFLVNDCVLQCGVQGLPFGGVGESGMGSYHGKFSVEAFSHKRACLNKHTTEKMNNLFRYPPYISAKLAWVNWALKSKPNSRSCVML